MYTYRLFELIKGEKHYVRRYDHNTHTGGDIIYYTRVVKDAMVFEAEYMLADSVVVKFGSLLHYEWILRNGNNLVVD